MRRKFYFYAVGATFAALCLHAPAKANAQTDSLPPARATLRGWEEQRWLTIFDRAGSYYGRFSDRGILQRFNQAMDSEYRLDLISFHPSLSEVYDWYQRGTGVRAWAGSFDHVRLALQGEFKARVPLGAGWATDVRFTQQDNLNVKRSLIWLGFQKDLFNGTGQAYAMGLVSAIKPDIDIEVGYSFLPRMGVITLAFGALDLFSDFIYQGLEVDPEVTDTTLDHTSRPYTFKLALDLQVARRFRLEGYGLAMTPTQIVVESQGNPGSGFVQDERYAYAGGLVEWEPSVRTAVGSFGTWVQARIERAAMPDGRAEDDFDLTEMTTQLGLFGIHRLSGRFSTELWVARVWRAEDRIRPDTTAGENIEYEDRSWAGRADFNYSANSGFNATLGLDFLAQDVIGPDRVPGSLQERDHARVRFDFAWRFSDRAFFLLGTNLDLDGDGQNILSFDGGHGRIAFYF
jgi:hypothetical protein